MRRNVDAIVVGAGPAGNAAALALARAGLDVVQFDRRARAGSAGEHGALLQADALEELLPDFRHEAPLERRIVEQRSWVLDARGHVATRHRCEPAAGGRAGRYSILRGPFEAWFSGRVATAGAKVTFGASVRELIREDDGRVVGVRLAAARDLYASVVVLADGIDASLVGDEAAEAARTSAPVTMTIKETLALPQHLVESRFDVADDDGVALETSSTSGGRLFGSGFVYTNRESLTAGIACTVADLVEHDVTPSELMSRFKAHPSIAPLVAGGEVRACSVHLVPQGWRTMARLFGDGWLACGDAAQTINHLLHREGATLPLTSGRIAAETIVELIRHGRPLTARHLSLYRDKLERSQVLRDLRHAGRAPEAAAIGRAAASRLPLGQAADELATIAATGGDDQRRVQEMQIVDSVLEDRAPATPVGDAVRTARAAR